MFIKLRRNLGDSMWKDILKRRQTYKDIQGGEEPDRARLAFRGDPQDAANRGGQIDLENPIQENPETMNYRVHLGPLTGLINRIVPKHEKWAARDKANTTKHRKLAAMLREYNLMVKQMIIDSDKRLKDGN